MTIKACRLILAAASLSLPAVSMAGQTEISAKLGKVAATLTTAYKAAPGAKEAPKTAVFTFSCSKELEKQRIGFAVSEILSHQLARDGVFRLVERTELNRVLEELKLGMSGVTEQSDAVKAGRLASAELLVLGSVEKLGSSYHVNARLVNAGTGEVIATAYEALNAGAFEKEAADYLTLVPRTQTLGIYFLASYRATSRVPSVTYNWTELSTPYTATTNPENPSVWIPGFGIRYSPFEHYTVDISYANSEKEQVGSKTTDHPTYSYPTYASRFTLLRALVGRNGTIYGPFSYFAAAGVTSVRVSAGVDLKYLTPTLLGRIEYKPQQRIGISLSAAYDITTKTAKSDLWVEGADFKISRLSQFYVEPSISIYF